MDIAKEKIRNLQANIRENHSKHTTKIQMETMRELLENTEDIFKGSNICLVRNKSKNSLK